MNGLSNNDSQTEYIHRTFWNTWDIPVKCYKLYSFRARGDNFKPVRVNPVSLSEGKVKKISVDVNISFDLFGLNFFWY